MSPPLLSPESGGGRRRRPLGAPGTRGAAPGPRGSPAVPGVCAPPRHAASATREHARSAGPARSRFDPFPGKRKRPGPPGAASGRCPRSSPGRVEGNRRAARPPGRWGRRDAALTKRLCQPLRGRRAARPRAPHARARADPAITKCGEGQSAGLRRRWPPGRWRARGPAAGASRPQPPRAGPFRPSGPSLAQCPGRRVLSAPRLPRGGPRRWGRRAGRARGTGG